MASVKLIPVTPLRTNRRPAFVNYGEGDPRNGLEEIDWPVYPKSVMGQMLRAQRNGCDITLGDCARLLGLTPADVSGLERGRATISADDWDAALNAIADEKARRAAKGGAVP